MRTSTSERCRGRLRAWARWHYVYPLFNDPRKGAQLMAAPGVKPVPVPTKETKPYWDGCKKHELHIQKCAACSHYQFYPRLYCTACMSDKVEWVKASGRGKVLSFTIVHRPVTQAFAGDVPYVVALITLDEGPQLMSNVVGCPPEKVHIGMPVEVTFEDWTADISVPKFKPV